MVINPSLPYSGLTVILEAPSRFDSSGLLGGYAGSWFDDCLLAEPKYSVYRNNIQIRLLADNHIPLLPNTKCLLLLGEATLKHYLPNVTLGEQRGSPFSYNGITCIASYTPQEAHDRRDYFKNEDDDESETDDDDAKSTHGTTRRKNWRFWLRQDIRKAVRLTRETCVRHEPYYHLFPPASEVIRLLAGTSEQTMYFDIETDAQLQLTCFGFAFDTDDIYVVPMLQTHHNPRRYYYDPITTCRILRALCKAICSNTVVIHNAMFDLFVLAWRYGLPVGGKVFDTMLAHSRLYIEVEKSLGHCISLYTDLPYHKNEGVYEPDDSAGYEQLLRYNGKDIYAMTQLKPAMEARAVSLKATESIDQVNRAVYPYLTAMLFGMRVDRTRIDKVITYNDRMKLQLQRILAILTHYPDFNANSWQQVARYLYDDLGIKKPDKDMTNEKTLLQLLLKQEVPAIHCILEYRKLGKQSGKLGFLPWGGVYLNGYNQETGEPAMPDRFTCSYNLAGTTTMRLSSRKLLGHKGKKPGTHFGSFGDNSQNWEKQLRKVIVPD